MGFEIQAFLKQHLRRLRRRLFSSRRAPPENDLRVAMARLATTETAQYILRSLPEVQSVSSWQEVHSLALQHVTIKDGLVLESGVFQARTINFIAGHAPWTVHGFDSFEGLPESWRDGFGKGAFSIATLPEVRANVVLHKGWFDEQIPVFLESQPRLRTHSHQSQKMTVAAIAMADMKVWAHRS